MTAGRRSVVAGAGVGIAMVTVIAMLGGLVIGSDGRREEVSRDRDRVLAATCISVLERAERADKALADRPSVGTAETYAEDRRSSQDDGRRPSSVGLFRDRCRPTSRSAQLSALVDLLSSRAR